MLILGIDSSDDFLAAGLTGPDGVIISKSSDSGAHNKNMLHGFVSDLFSETGYDIKSIDGVSISIGPGSFTGLRVGLAVAKGICWSLKLPLTGVSSLMAVAYSADTFIDKILAVKDARQNEFYFGAFSREGNFLRQSIPDSVGAAEEIIVLLSQNYTPVGPGLSALARKIHDLSMPSPSQYSKDSLGGVIALLGRRQILQGETLDIATAIPRYIRNPKPKEWNL